MKLYSLSWFTQHIQRDKWKHMGSQERSSIKTGNVLTIFERENEILGKPSSFFNLRSSNNYGSQNMGSMIVKRWRNLWTHM